MQASAQTVEKGVPTPYGPVPTANQLRWHEMEYYGLVCYGLNTYTGQEWGYGDVDPKVFNPSNLDTDQWARVARDSGMKGLILVAKHHDGFCLWPSKTTKYTVAATPWKDGKGDVLGDLAKSCRKFGLKLGVYVSPWDRNHAEYGREQYVKDYHQQWREVLEYDDDIFEVWFDGANGGTGYYGGAREKRSIPKNYYQYDKVFEIIKKRQPQAIFFGGSVKDASRWVGNESGYAGTTNWCRFSGGGDRKARENGRKNGKHWMPAEADTTILHPKKWYYNSNSKPRTLKQFVDLYYTTIGRNAAFDLGLSIGPDGQIPKRDVKAMLAQKKQLDKEFAVNLVTNAKVSATDVRGGFAAAHTIDKSTKTYWATDDGVKKASLTLDFGKGTTFNRLLLQEHIALGQRVHGFTLEANEDGNWNEVAKGTTVGYKRILRFNAVKAAIVRLTLETDAPCLTLSNLAIYNAPPILADPIISRDRKGSVRINTDKGLIVYCALGPDPTPAQYKKYTAPFKLPKGGLVHTYAVHESSKAKTGVVTEEFGIVKTKWSIHSVDSENKKHTPAKNAIDGDPKTIWATEWQGKQPKHPHYIAIDIGEAIEISGFSYLPRQDGNKDGLIFDYEFYISADGKEWGTPIAEGHFGNIENNPIRQVIKFRKAVRGQFVKLVSKSAVRGKPFAVAAEIGVYGQ